ncbi:hypothetical protein NDU88_003400 [Pleurodeles waltl]|uniref:Uncharacterized protein n=1 Tax=Pleurodeles waltl TaxID=8319 RepID=A0AAV7TP30_PLEWA|nr:hypothetical protein NDU88_003400 [Pleurodeles waltl]
MASTNMIKQLIEISEEEYEKHCKEVDNLTQRIEEANWGEITTKNYAILNSVIDRYEEDLIQRKNRNSIDLFSTAVLRDLDREYNRYCDQRKYLPSNINSDQAAGLTHLRSNSHITIKEADKGGNIIILNTHDYLKEAYRHLQDKNC